MADRPGSVHRGGGSVGAAGLVAVLTSGLLLAALAWQPVGWDASSRRDDPDSLTGADGEAADVDWLGGEGATLRGAVVMGASTTRRAVEPMEDSELRDALEASVLLVDARACGVRRQGTLTMLSADGGSVGLTNAHVVQGAQDVVLSGAGTGVSEARVAEYVSGRDAASVDLSGLPVAPGSGLRAGERPAPGDEVTVAGFGGGAWSTATGSVLRWSRLRILGSLVDVFAVDVAAERGSSGGVVVDAAGAAVGLVTERDPRTGHALVQPIDDLLGRPGRAAPGC